MLFLITPLCFITPQWLIVRALWLYKFSISPLLPSACRFHPTCSEYMCQAVQHYGAAKGVWMGLRRLARCHPFHAGGFDPVR
jgi:putative membrane protein insertion efficiency factor